MVPSADLASLSHEIVLIGGGVLILLLDAFLPSSRRLSNPLAILTVVVAALMPWSPVPASTSFSSLLIQDGITMFASLAILVATLLCLLASRGYLERERLAPAEYYALLLWCAAGMLLMKR